MEVQSLFVLSDTGKVLKILLKFNYNVKYPKNNDFEVIEKRNWILIKEAAKNDFIPWQKIINPE